MKQLLKKTAALWLAALIALIALWAPADLHADAASAGSAYLTVEMLSLDLGFLCAPAKIEIESGETAAQTLMRFLSARGYAAYFTGTAAKGFKLGYIADGDKSAAYNGYSSSAKAYPVKTPEKINIEGKLSPLAVALLGSYGVTWDPEKNVKLEGYIGQKDLTEKAGWVFSVNNKYVTGSLSDVKLAAGDTFRVQFSLAEGRDLGYSINAGGAVSSADADRSKLIKLVADYSSNHANSEFYDQAYAALRNVNLTNEDVTRLYGALTNELKTLNLYNAETSTTTKKAETTSTTTTTKKAETSSTTTKKAESSSTTTTTKKAETSSTTTTKKAESSSTTTTKKASSGTTNSSSSSVTVKPYTPLTTSAGGANALLTTMVGGTTLPGETTTMDRPTGIILEYLAKEVPTTEPETTAEDSSEETTAAPRSLLDTLNEWRKSDGTVRNIVITAAVVLAAAIAVLIIIAKNKNKTTV